MQRESLLPLGALIGGSTVVLTAAFVGVVAVVSASVAGVPGRIPFYALGGGAVFVAAIVVLDDPDAGGVSVLTATIGVTVLGFALLSLGGEGVLYALRDPGRIVGSQLVVYFLAAGLVCTGTAYWGLHHWREFVAAE